MLSTYFPYNPNSYGTFLEKIKTYGLSRPTDVNPIFATIGISSNIVVMGRSFIGISGVYLSGGPYSAISTLHAPFSAISQEHMSTKFPAFTAFKVDSYSVNIDSDCILTITIPPPSATGYFDIIIQNDAGYGMLSKFSKKFGSYQPPYYRNGVLVVSNDNNIFIADGNGNIITDEDGNFISVNI